MRNILLGLVASVTVAFTSCQGSNVDKQAASTTTCDPTSKTVRTVTDVAGVVYRDEPSQRYQIHAAQAGTVDVVDVGVVCGTLPSELQKEGTKVVFSGIYKEYVAPPSAPAGTTFYNLELTKVAAQ